MEFKLCKYEALRIYGERLLIYINDGTPNSFEPDHLVLTSSSMDLLLIMQVIELQLPSFFNNFDPREAAANLPPSKSFSSSSNLV